MRWIHVFLAAMIGLTACTSGAPIARSQGASPLTSPLPTREWTMSGSEDAMMVFERSGGLAGVQEVWRFYEDGRVVKTERRGNATVEAQLSPDLVKDAVQRIVEEGFMDLADEYMPANRCYDRFTYRLTIAHAGTVKTVTTMDGAEWPPALVRALEVVNSLIGQATSGQ